MERYRLEGIAGGMRGLGENLVLECDYVASCAALARTEAVRRFGGFPEENFIYWDDVEWCTKCRQAGYKVVVTGMPGPTMTWQALLCGQEPVSVLFKVPATGAPGCVLQRHYGGIFPAKLRCDAEREARDGVYGMECTG